MRLDYTITTGDIYCGDQSRKLPFALVFYEDGLYYVETFLPDKDFYENNKYAAYQLIGKTEKGYDIEITDLYMRRFKFGVCKLEAVCYGYIKLTDQRDHKHWQKKDENYDDSIYIVEVEGLKMKFADHTTIEKYRRTGDDQKHFEFDHTQCVMCINFSEREGNHFKLVFADSPSGENIIMDFSEHLGYQRLTYKNYLVFKDALLSFLSFMNGGQVTVRKEMTGSFITSSGTAYINSQIVYLYSRKKEHSRDLNHFLPINNHHSYSSEIVPNLFVLCFDKFYQMNKSLDFMSLIFSLNNATQTAGLEEKYFILITALEKICTNFARTLSGSSETLLSADLFTSKIKPALEEVLKGYEQQIKSENISAWLALKSKLGNLNKRHKNETSQKMREFFAYAKININSEVERLIELERNQAVHQGIIGSTENERIKNYLKLDHILRDIILNLIGYNRIRNYDYKYFELP